MMNVPKAGTALLNSAAGSAFTLFLLRTQFAIASWPELSLRIAAVAAPLLFLAASLIVFYRPIFAHASGLLAAIFALLVLVRTELAFGFVNSWIALNMQGGFDERSIRLASTQIIATGVVLVAGLVSLLRLAPRSWTFRGIRVCDRTWPSFAVSLIVIATWFSRSVLPYRVPIIVDATPPEIAILHVDKRGLQFHETTISVYKDARFYVWHNDRRQLHYGFQETGSWGVLPADVRSMVTAVIDSPQLQALKTHNPERLTHRNAEGWYVLTRRSPIMSFSSEHGAQPPQNIVFLFSAIEHVPLSGSWNDIARDVCLGFCYDPTAGMGIKYVNQRCRTDEKGITSCS